MRLPAAIWMCLLLLVPVLPKSSQVTGYSFVSYQCCGNKRISREQAEAERIQSIVSKCYQSQCRHWILECHWFCDAIRGLEEHERCMDCLKMRGMGCYECFDL